jgi:membrane fusion protein YbhG
MSISVTSQAICVAACLPWRRTVLRPAGTCRLNRLRNSITEWASDAGVVLTCAVLLASCGSDQPGNSVRVSGHVEATEVQVSSEVGGRLVELRVDEGDRLKQGDVIAHLDTRDTEIQLQRARADRDQADAQLRLLRAGSRAEDIRQAQAQRDAAETDAAAAEAELRSAETDLERFESLLRANAGSQKQRDDAKAQADVARERLRGANERIRAAREALNRLMAGARPQEIEAARARVAAVDAQIAALEKSLKDATVVSPLAGIVTLKLADQGEVLPPRTPVVVVTDLDHAWANLFIPEPVVPRVKLGQKATVFTDAGGAGIDGKVTFISPKAEFTPRNVQTADERSKLVYRIKVSVDNSQGVLKQGMPVDADLPLGQ